MLSKRYRLTKRGSFAYVYRKGESRGKGSLRITFVKSRGTPKVGISVPNTVGKAVVRNKIRRRIRAAVRPMMPHVKPSQTVISVRKGGDGLTYAEIESTLAELFSANGLYEKKDNAASGN